MKPASLAFDLTPEKPPGIPRKRAMENPSLDVVPSAAPPADLSPSGGNQQLLRFAVGAQGYAILIDDVRELIEVPPMTSLPLIPDFVRGVINLRGAVVPIIDLSARLGKPPIRLSRRSCVIVVDVRGRDGASCAPQKIGMLVDAVHEVIDVDIDHIETPPALGTRVSADLLSGMVRVRQNIVEILNLAKILDLELLADLIGSHALH
jgi:purine-binding chemotaxis protein CheW